MKLIFLFIFLVINGFIFYFLPQKSIQIWLHSETLVPCPVNPAWNCCFIEAIFSLNNNQTFIASFMLGAGGVSCSIALFCPSCSFQLCSLVWRKCQRKKKRALLEPVFIFTNHLINWSNMTLSPALPSFVFQQPSSKITNNEVHTKKLRRGGHTNWTLLWKSALWNMASILGSC